MTSEGTIVHPVTVLHAGRLIAGQLIYRPADPLAVTMRLMQGGDTADWEYSRDLLKVGLVVTDNLMGPGDVSTRRYKADVVIVVRNTSRDQEVMMLIPATQVAKFLRALPAAEIDFDSELDELLKGTEEK